MPTEIRTLKDKDIQVLPRTRADAVSTIDGSTVQDKINNIPTNEEKETWNNKSDFSGSYNDLTDKPSIPIVSNSVSSTSTTTAASSSAVKQAYDLGSNAMPKSGGTFTGSIYAGTNYQNYSTYLLRNTRLNSSDIAPTVNGQICWTYD